MIKLIAIALIVVAAVFASRDGELVPDDFCYKKLTSLPNTTVIKDDVRLDYPIISFSEGEISYKMDVRFIEAENPTRVVETYQYEIDHGYKPTIAIQTIGNRQVISMVVGIRNKRTNKTFSCSLHQIANFSFTILPKQPTYPNPKTRA